MPALRDAYRVAPVNGRIYVIGNMARGAQVLEYDPATDRWKAKAAMPRENWCQVAAESGGRIYVIGGGFPAPIPLVYEFRPEQRMGRNPSRE